MLIVVNPVCSASSEGEGQSHVSMKIITTLMTITLRPNSPFSTIKIMINRGRMCSLVPYTFLGQLSPVCLALSFPTASVSSGD